MMFNRTQKRLAGIICLCAILSLFLSCRKSWLEAKPDKSLAVPSTIADCQAMLDNTTLFNTQDVIYDEVGTDNFYISSSAYDNQSFLHKNLYVWAADIFENNLDNFTVWSQPYKRIFTANIVLESIEEIVPKNNREQAAWNDVKGGALFHRAYNHYSMAKLFSKAYDKNAASADLGTPIRTTSNINIPVTRPSVQETYDLIVSDLKTAASILPIQAPTATTPYRSRPTVAAATAMLARVYLSMSSYDSAWKYANQSLQLYNRLLNYNLNPPANPTNNITSSFQRFNDEVLFEITALNVNILSVAQSFIDSNLYKLYETNDRRKVIFFKTQNSPSPSPTFKLSYGAGSALFTGLAVDEIYLIRAECYARGINGNAGDKVKALEDLNSLLRNRYSSFTDVVATDANAALQRILTERRKELCFRGIRWSDLKRLNKEPQFAVTLIKKVKNGTETHTLEPNSPLYVLPFPPNVILLSGMQQNPR